MYVRNGESINYNYLFNFKIDSVQEFSIIFINSLSIIL